MDFFTYFELFKKYKKSIILICITSIMLAVVLIIVLPKKYKSIGVISISVKYFQNPLVKEFITETYDSSEMKAQRESMILAAISDKFVDQIAEKYELYDGKAVEGSQQLYFQRSLLRSKIDIVSLSSSVSQISFYSNNPKQSHDVVQLIFAKIISHLKQQRQKFLVNLRASMKKRIDSLIASIGYSVVLKDTDAGFSQNPMLSTEREKLKNEISEKLKFYNKNHPLIISLNKKLLNIERELNDSESKYATEESVPVISQAKIDGSLPIVDQSNQDQDLMAGWAKRHHENKEDELLLSNSANLIKSNNVVYEDLVRKFEYLNIAINSEDSEASAYTTILQNPSYPLAYIFPNRAFFLMWGLIAGFLLSSVYVALLENIQIRSIIFKPKKASSNVALGPLQTLTPSEFASSDRESPLHFD